MASYEYCPWPFGPFVVLLCWTQASHWILYHACLDIKLCLLLPITCTCMCNIQWYCHRELDSAWQFSYRTDVHCTCNAKENKVKEQNDITVYNYCACVSQVSMNWLASNTEQALLHRKDVGNISSVVTAPIRSYGDTSTELQ